MSQTKAIPQVHHLRDMPAAIASVQVRRLSTTRPPFLTSPDVPGLLVATATHVVFSRNQSRRHRFARIGGSHEENEMASQTLNALYSDEAKAELALDRLRAIGLPEGSLEMHRASDGDIQPGSAPSGGLFALGDILRNRGDEHGIAGQGTVLMAFNVPERLVSEAISILNRDAIEVERGRNSA
jgi:hypothetical protein